jgi:hypothetical protein
MAGDRTFVLADEHDLSRDFDELVPGKAVAASDIGKAQRGLYGAKRSIGYQIDY